MTRTAGAPIGCQRPSRFWGLGCPKIYHEAEDTLVGRPGIVIGVDDEGELAQQVRTTQPMAALVIREIRGPTVM
ncbi:hypothetical protein, partial [Thiolapillus sp.]|uniref:hypothetical protein n=1 Tax=Thiolapillus sp. TaxID=2017437 RepID=UPI003AF57020